MPQLTDIARWTMIAGLMLFAIGGILWLVSRLGLPFGKLPGDFYVQGENASCFIPLASMLILSVLLTLLVNILLRILNR